VFQRNARFSEGAEPVPKLGAANLDLEKVYDFYEQLDQSTYFCVDDHTDVHDVLCVSGDFLGFCLFGGRFWV